MFTYCRYMHVYLHTHKNDKNLSPAVNYIDTCQPLTYSINIFTSPQLIVYLYII